jgi:hypothetical protein
MDARHSVFGNRYSLPDIRYALPGTRYRFALLLVGAGVVSGGMGIMVPPIYLLGGIAACLFIPWLVVGGNRARLCALVLAGSVTRYTVDVGGFTVRPEEVVTILVAVIMAGSMLARHEQLRGGILNLVVLLWLGANAAAGLLGVYPLESTRAAALMTLTVMPFFLVQTLVSNEAEFRFTLKCVAVIGCLEAAFGLLVIAVYYLTGQNLGVQLDPISGAPSPYGTQWESNIFGSFVMAALLATLGLLFSRSADEKRSPALQWALVLMITVDAAAVMVSLARGAWVGLAAGSLLAVPYLWSRKWQIFRLASVAGVATAVGLSLLLTMGNGVDQVAANFISRFQGVVNIIDDPTVSERTQSSSLALSDWSTSVITGLGPGTFAIRYRSTSGTPAWIGNMLVARLYDAGVIGLILFIVAWFGVMISAWIAQRGPPQNDLKVQVRAVLMTVVGISVAYQATDASILAWPWIYLGLLATGASLVRHSAHISPRS